MLDQDLDTAALMEEPPHGHNHGRRALEGSPPSAGDPPTHNVERLPLNTEDWQRREFMQAGGFGVVTTGSGRNSAHGATGYLDAGMTVHRGVLHPDEYVDHEELVSGVERHLGFTFEEVRSVYHRPGGPLPTDLRPLRDRIDARLSELAAADGLNIAQLAEVIGITEKAIDRGLVRARSREAS